MNSLNGKKLRKSFYYAVKGVADLLRTEQNARIHLIATIAVFILAVLFRINRLEVAVIFMAVILVFAMEIINTAIEKMLDLLHPQSHYMIAKIKDAMAGAVLISATIAVVVFVLVFYPHFINWWQSFR